MEDLIIVEMSKNAVVWIAIVFVILIVISAIAGFYLGMGANK